MQKKTEGFDEDLTQLHPILSSCSSQKSAKSATPHLKNSRRPIVLFYPLNLHIYLPDSEIWRDLAPK
jgi:hypothetical protein